MRDLFNDLDYRPALAPSAATADNTPVNTLSVDMADLKSAVLVLLTGALADADATFTVSAKESDTGAFAGEETDVTDGDLLGTEALAGFQFDDDNKVRKLGFLPSGKRYKRVTITPANNASAANLAGLWLVDPNQSPTANPPA